jgi:hypothetical protein
MRPLFGAAFLLPRFFMPFRRDEVAYFHGAGEVFDWDSSDYWRMTAQPEATQTRVACANNYAEVVFLRVRK